MNSVLSFDSLHHQLLLSAAASKPIRGWSVAGRRLLLSSWPGSSSDSALSALQCHFTWDLNCNDQRLFCLIDDLIDICPTESTPWRGQIYNLQGFIQARLGRSSEALTLFCSASDVLTGPELLVNYSDLAWLHHQREEPEQSQEYLSRVEQLSREHPTEGDLPRPEVLAEKAWSLMKFSREQKLEAVELFEAALKQEPHRAEWRSSQAIAIASIHKLYQDLVDQEVLKKMQEAHKNDPENLYLSAVCLIQRQLHGESVEEEMNDLANRIIPTANSSYSGFKPVIRFYRQIKQEDIAIRWAEEALELHPDSRYVIRCAALCYKWRVLFKKDEVSQPHLVNRAMSLQKQVIQLYPHSALVKEMDLADLHSKSEISKGEEMYKSLLQRNMEPSDKQLLYNRYAKYLLNTKQDNGKAIKYFKKAVRIDYDSFFRNNSIEILMNFTKSSRESVLAEAQRSSQIAKLENLECHFTWQLNRSKSILFSVRDRLEDLLYDESTPWRGQMYNLQGFIQARLGRSSEALTLFCSASDVLTGPELLVNYSDLAWLHHQREEPEQSQEYLSRVEQLSREHPTEGDLPRPEVLAEKAFSLMEFYNVQKPLAVNRFEEALMQQPQRVEWLSAQAIALVRAKRHQEPLDEEVLIKMKRALDQDPDNLELYAEYLYQQDRKEKQRNLREQSSWRREQRGEQSTSTAAHLKQEASAVAAQLLEKPVTLHRDIRSVLELQRSVVSVDAAVSLAEKALQKFLDSRYLKSCLSMSLKWKVDHQRDRASQELIERTAHLLSEVISLYPDSCFKTEIDRANVLAKSNHSLSQADRIYQDLLLRRDLEPVSKQQLYNSYAKFLKFDKQEFELSIDFHIKAAEIPERSYFKNNSIAFLKKITPKDRRLRKKIEDCLENIEK
ncbi:hypothetical protein WMY93_032100 [Mugilogobius chulae]|uniref:Uncharacterized protein n=1 Tax=Mugilogobius chulae TaxID=88201 RepID=A0AAW0MCK4_9GOBI